MTIRPARPDDFARLQEIERAAGEAFRPLGMDLVADDEPFTDAELAAYQEDGRAWVAVDADDVPAAYLLVDEVDGTGHVEQVSVHPEHARQGFGRALIDVAADWSARRGLPALTLTTYAEVPWNGPYYQRLGFRTLAADEVPPGIARIRARERAHGLDRWPRVTMRRPLAPAAPA